MSAAISIAGPSLQAEHDVNAVMAMVRRGRGQMPTFGRVLQPEQIDDVAEFVTQHIAVIPLAGGNLSQGGELFRVNCAACHRTAVRGGALAFAGTNAPALTGKSAALVAGAIRWGPGPMPAFPASVLNDQQVASIAKYVTYVERPPNPGGAALNWYGPVAEGWVAWAAILGLLVISVLIELGGKG